MKLLDTVSLVGHGETMAWGVGGVIRNAGRELVAENWVGGLVLGQKPRIGSATARIQ